MVFKNRKSICLFLQMQCHSHHNLSEFQKNRSNILRNFCMSLNLLLCVKFDNIALKIQICEEKEDGADVLRIRNIWNDLPTLL